MNKLKSIVYLIVLLVLSNIRIAIASDQISFHLVKENCTTCSLNKYTLGSKIFPNYKEHLLNDNFLIKNDPELIIKSNEITKIQIKHKTTNISYFEVTILLDNEASNRLKSYTLNNFGTKNTVQLGNTILALASIQFVLEKNFSFFIRNQTDEQVVKIFSQLSKKIEIN